MRNDKTLSGKKIGVALTGSFCTMKTVMRLIEQLIKDEGAIVYPIISQNVQQLDTKFGESAQWRQALTELGCEPPILSIPEAEPIGPTGFLDILVIAPCSGNTMAKLCHGITDGPVLMATKAHLRNSKPVVLALATNDGLGMNAKNWGELMNVKNIYFVPFGQDNATAKPNSIIFDDTKLIETLKLALAGRQMQPVLVQYGA